MITAAEAIAKLKEGNDLYISTDTFKTDISSAVLEHFARNGQEPYGRIVKLFINSQEYYQGENKC